MFKRRNTFFLIHQGVRAMGEKEAGGLTSILTSGRSLIPFIFEEV